MAVIKKIYTATITTDLSGYTAAGSDTNDTNMVDAIGTILVTIKFTKQ